MIRKMSVFLLTACCLQATAIRLENNSIYPLKAVVQGADGSVLTEVFLEAKETKNWSDSPGFTVKKAPAKSLTPLTVHWYCKNGKSFSVSDHVSTGALVRSRDGSGNKSCSQDTKENTP